MPFVRDDFTTLSPQIAGLRVYRYTTPDASVTTANYFDPTAADLAVGDVIITTLDNDGTISGVIYLVTEVTSAGVVTIAAFA